MVDGPDTLRRLRLRVALKLMLAVAIAGVGLMSLRFLAGGPERPARLRVDLAGVAPGQTRTVGWQGRAVVVLHRRKETVAALDLDAGRASPWFVAFATGTARGCPVVWQAEPARFREACGDAAWDAAGRPVAPPAEAPLESPPHRITADGRLILGHS
jgi:Rieske Fe-S protein